MELSIERSEESFKNPEIIKPEPFEEPVIESTEIQIPVEKIEDNEKSDLPQENIATEKESLNEIPVTLKNETGLDCTSLSPSCGQGLDIVNVVSLKMEDFQKLDDKKTDVLDISEELVQSIEIEVEEEEEEEENFTEENLYDDFDESETEEQQTFPVQTMDSSTIVLDDDDDEDEDEIDEEEGGEIDDEDEEEEEDIDEDDLDEDDSDIEEIQSSPIKKTPNDYDPMEGTSSNIQGDWDRWRIKKKKELEEAALVPARPLPINMKPRRRTFLQRIKKRSIKW